MADEFSLRDFIPIYLAAGIGEEALFRAARVEEARQKARTAYDKRPILRVVNRSEPSLYIYTDLNSQKALVRCFTLSKLFSREHKVTPPPLSKIRFLPQIHRSPISQQ